MIKSGIISEDGKRLMEERAKFRLRVHKYLSDELKDIVVLIVTLDGRIIEANELFLRLLSYDVEDVRYKMVTEFVILEDRDRTQTELLSDYRFKENYSFTNTYIGKNGEELTLKWRPGIRGGNVAYAEAEIVKYDNKANSHRRSVSDQ